MKIIVGQIAPSFTTTDIQGNPVRLEDYRGKLLLLVFHRLAACPFCGLRIYSLSLRYPTFREQGLEVVAFIESSDANILKQTYAQSAPFPIVADPQQQFYHLYGTQLSRLGVWWANLTRKATIAESQRLGFGSGKVDGAPYRMPADFLIGPDLTVRYTHYGRDSGDSLQFRQIEELIRKFANKEPLNFAVQ